MNLGLAGKKSEFKFIPLIYKLTSVFNRLEILAGLIDTDGYHDGIGGYDYITKSPQLSHDIVFIARSLGLSAYERIKYCKCQTGAGGYYHRINISGNTNIIPCRIKRKQATKRLINKNCLVTGFKLKEAGVDDFYGFELDGDHLYLTSDFFVHHNSGKSLIIADIASKLDGHILVFQPSKEILEQNFAKLCSYGILDCSIYSASLNSKNISRITFATIGSAINNKELFSHFKYIIIDECHFVNAKQGMYMEFLEQMNVPVLGLTATPYRLSSTSFGSILKFITRTRPRVFKEVIYHCQVGELLKRGYLAKMEYYQVKAIKSSNLVLNSTKADYTDKSVKAEYKRAGFESKILEIIERLIKAKRENILVFTRFVEEAQYLVDHLGGLAEIITAQTPKKEREKILNDFKNGEIRAVCNVGILTTGFDYPELSTIVLARPTMSLALYYQMVGRAIRPHKDKPCSWVVDLCENYDRFGKVEDLVLTEEKQGLWYVKSGDKQLTNVYYT